jgi:hypothetical protein
MDRWVTDLLDKPEKTRAASLYELLLRLNLKLLLRLNLNMSNLDERGLLSAG